MASFLNTGILGQVTGGSLGVGQLAGSFKSFRDRVKANKKRRVGISAAEREATAARRAKRISDAETRHGISVDTSDVSPVDATKGISSAVQPVASAPSLDQLAPELQYTEAEGQFVTALSDWNRHIGGKNNSDINRGRGQTQGYLQNVVDLAKATGREDLIGAVGGIEGILGQRKIGSRNVGQAKATTNKAVARVRETLDIERIMQQMGSAKGQPKVTSGARKIASKGLTTRR